MAYETDTQTAAPELLTAEERAEFEQIFRTEFPRLLKSAYTFTHSDPEDLVQTAFTNALRNWHNFQDNGASRGAWLQRILMNAGKDAYRKSQRRPEYLISDGYDHLFDTSDPTTAGQFELAESDKSVAKRIDSLVDEKRKKMLEMRAQGYQYDEISDQLGIAIGTVKSGLFRAAKLLAEDPELIEAYNEN